MKKIGFALFLFALPAACRRDPVVARVGGLEITESEFRLKLADVAPDYQNYVLTPNGRRQFLDVLIREKLILAAAQDSGIQREPAFRAQWEKLKAEEEHKLSQGREYLTIQMWRVELRNRGILKVTDKEVAEQYARYPREVHVSHILFATAEDAEAALRKLRGGASFATLAKDSLDAETALDGGRMKPALHGEIIPELEDVVFKGRVGELVGPIRSKFGYHLLKKEAERPTKLEEVRERIRLTLEKQKLDQYLQTLQPRFPVEVVDVQFK
ncbi:MAG: peptidyl-prolyl cis-trans isomerase [Elusimicrobia bacterium]|nr:peptidyl-prolyl cis-trans isomerase [Elusimicrobiota bacterium]